MPQHHLFAASIKRNRNGGRKGESHGRGEPAGGCERTNEEEGLHLFLKQDSVRKQTTLAFDHERPQRNKPSGRPYRCRPCSERGSVSNLGQTVWGWRARICAVAGAGIEC